jgi:hypothetical protein
MTTAIMKDARAHSEYIRSVLSELTDLLQSDLDCYADPHARALFRTTATVLWGLGKVFEDFEQGREPA